MYFFFFIFSTTNVSGDVSVYGGGRKPPYAGDGSNGTSREPPTDDPDLRGYPQPGYPQYQKFGTKTTRKETHCEGDYIMYLISSRLRDHPYSTSTKRLGVWGQKTGIFC